MASDAIFGLVGVIVGGALTGGVDYVLEHGRKKRQAQASARLIHAALNEVSSFLEVSIAMRQWLEEPEKVLSPQPWREQRSALAEAPGFDGWYPVAGAWSYIDNIRRRVTQAEEGIGDDPFANRDPEFFRLGLMLIGIAEDSLLKYAKTRTYKDKDDPTSDRSEDQLSKLFEQALEKDVQK